MANQERPIGDYERFVNKKVTVKDMEVIHEVLWEAQHFVEREIFHILNLLERGKTPDMFFVVERSKDAKSLELHIKALLGQ